MSKMCEIYIYIYIFYRNCVRISKLLIISPKKKRISSKNLMEENKWVKKKKINNVIDSLGFGEVVVSGILVD